MAGEAGGDVTGVELDEPPDEPVPDVVVPPLTLLAPLPGVEGAVGTAAPPEPPKEPPVSLLVGVVDVPPPPPHPLSNAANNAPSTHSLFLLNPVTATTSFLLINLNEDC